MNLLHIRYLLIAEVLLAVISFFLLFRSKSEKKFFLITVPVFGFFISALTTFLHFLFYLRGVESELTSRNYSILVETVGFHYKYLSFELILSTVFFIINIILAFKMYKAKPDISSVFK